MTVHMAEKGSSPFYPGQPVPPELFVGRIDQIDWIISRGARQVSEGKPIAVFVEGEYGIGKSSIAKFVSWLAEERYGLLPVYASIGGTKSIEDVAVAMVEATLRTGIFDPTRKEAVRNWVGGYLGQQRIFGFNVNLEAIKKDAPKIASPYGILSFLEEAAERLGGGKANGIFLILDEINGITQQPEFAHFIKGIVDTNAMAHEPLPLLLMLCGVEDRRRDMINNHPPTDRLFHVLGINPLDADDTRNFFAKAFAAASIEVDDEALSTFVHFSAGFPKIMHEIGDAAYWRDQDGKIDGSEALMAVLDAADTVTKKYVNNQILAAIRSEDYRVILETIASEEPDEMVFTRSELLPRLKPSEQSKLDTCLRRLRELGVIRRGEVRGTYEWINRMVRLALWLQTVRAVAPSVESESGSDGN